MHALRLGCLIIIDLVDSLHLLHTCALILKLLHSVL
jgi:hypothetical protein